MHDTSDLIAHERLLELLDYDPETGIFRWKKITSNRAKVGAVMGFLDHHGHRCIRVDRHRYGAHRLAWFYVYGVWPKEQIDHKNLIKDDNRIDNLREATHAENVRNVTRKRHNKTGFKGVMRHSQAKHKFAAQITIGGRPKYLGLFDTPEEAHAAYAKASEELHGSFGRIN